MLAEQYQEIRSLASWLCATPADLLSIAREVAGDEQILHIEELSVTGAGEVIEMLRVCGRRHQTINQFVATLA